MSKIPVYICNHKRCMVCYRTLCGRTFDKEFAELDKNGEPIIDHYVSYGEEVNFKEVAK